MKDIQVVRVEYNTFMKIYKDLTEKALYIEECEFNGYKITVMDIFGVGTGRVLRIVNNKNVLVFREPVYMYSMMNKLINAND